MEVVSAHRQPRFASRQTQARANTLLPNTVSKHHRPHTQPQFSGLIPERAIDPLITAFAQMTEVFLWGFLAQDAIAFWSPRIPVSLSRGAIEVDLQKFRNDPVNKGLHPWELYKKYIIEKVRGWNWAGFSEESGREFATGPGVLIIPTILFSVFRRILAGKNSVELGYGPLTQLTDSFRHAVEQNNTLNNPQTKVPPQEFYSEFERFLVNRFDYAGLSRKINTLMSTHNPNHTNIDYHTVPFKLPQKAFEYRKAHSAWETTKAWFIRRVDPQYQLSQKPNLSEVIGLDATKEGTQSIDDVIKRWASLYRKVVSNEITVPNTSQDDLLHAVNQYLSEAIENGFNRAHLQKLPAHLDQLNFSNHINYAPLKFHFREQASNAATLVEKTHWRNLGGFLENLHNWGDFLRNALTTQHRTGQGLAGLIETLYKNTVAQKGWIALIATTLSGIYLVWLAHTMQSHDEYVANRLLQDTKESGPFKNRPRSQHEQSAIHHLGPSRGLFDSPSPLSSPLTFAHLNAHMKHQEYRQ